MPQKSNPYIKAVLTYATNSPFKPHYSCTLLLDSDLEWDALVAAWRDRRCKLWVGANGAVRLRTPTREVISITRPPRQQ